MPGSWLVAKRVRAVLDRRVSVAITVSLGDELKWRFCAKQSKQTRAALRLVTAGLRGSMACVNGAFFSKRCNQAWESNPPPQRGKMPIASITSFSVRFSIQARWTLSSSIEMFNGLRPTI